MENSVFLPFVERNCHKSCCMLIVFHEKQRASTFALIALLFYEMNVLPADYVCVV